MSAVKKKASPRSDSVLLRGDGDGDGTVTSRGKGWYRRRAGDTAGERKLERSRSR